MPKAHNSCVKFHSLRSLCHNRRLPWIPPCLRRALRQDYLAEPIRQTLTHSLLFMSSMSTLHTKIVGQLASGLEGAIGVALYRCQSSQQHRTKNTYTVRLDLLLLDLVLVSDVSALGSELFG